MRRIVAFALLAALCAPSSGVHGEGRPRYGGSLEGSLLGAPVTLDPPMAQAHAELRLALEMEGVGA